MLTEIKKQFYDATLKELESITQKLEPEGLPQHDYPVVTEQIFSLSHQICGTGPMLGFDAASKVSRKLEKTFHEIKLGQRELTPQVIWQTRRTMELLIKTFIEENNALEK